MQKFSWMKGGGEKKVSSWHKMVVEFDAASKMGHSSKGAQVCTCPQSKHTLCSVPEGYMDSQCKKESIQESKSGEKWVL